MNRLRWPSKDKYSTEIVAFQKLSTTIDIRSELRDERFDLNLQPLSQNWYFSEDRNENFSLCGFTAVLKRSPNPYLMNTYLPTGLVTLASFIGFLIPVDMVPGRMALLVTTFLMLVNIGGTEQRTGPEVSQLTFVMDISLLKRRYFPDKKSNSHGHLAAPMHAVCCLGHI